MLEFLLTNKFNKNTDMPKYSQIFTQVMQLLDWKLFDGIVNKYEGDRGAKGISCRSLLATMIFACLAGADSLKPTVEALETIGGTLPNLGVERVPSRSNLGYCLAHRPAGLFREFFEAYASSLSKRLYGKHKPNRLKRKVFSVDSTVISLCLSLFDWAKFHHRKGAAKAHTLLDHDGLIPSVVQVTAGSEHDAPVFERMLDDLAWKLLPGSIVLMDRGYVSFDLFRKMSDMGLVFVTRLKKNMVYEVKEEYAVPKVSGLVSDRKVFFQSQAGKECSELRLVTAKVVVRGKEKSMSFLTNSTTLAASTIVLLYKARWEVENFFKSLKQNLEIESFMGTSKNAVEIQIYASMISMLLLKELKKVSDSKRKEADLEPFGFSSFVTSLRPSLFRLMPLENWLQKPFAPPDETESSGQQNLFPPGFLGQQSVPQRKILPQQPLRL